MSHKARKLLTQDAVDGLKQLVRIIPSQSVLVIVGPETVPWDMVDDPQRKRFFTGELDARRVIGGEAQRQIDYANWGWLKGPFGSPSVVVVPHTLYAVQTFEKIEFLGATQMVAIPELCAFSHPGGWSDREEREIWGETRASVLARHFHGGWKVNGKHGFSWYLERAIPTLLKNLVEFNSIASLTRYTDEKPLTFILPPVYAQILAWAWAETLRRTRSKKDGRPATQDIINQPFYGCDTILVAPHGVSIMRSGWEPSEFDRKRRTRAERASH